MEKYEESIALFDRYLYLDRTSVSILYQKGCAYFALKKFGEALSSFDLAIESDSNHIGSLVKKGQSLSELKRYEEAGPILDRVIALDLEKCHCPFCHGYRSGTSFPVRGCGHSA